MNIPSLLSLFWSLYSKLCLKFRSIDAIDLRYFLFGISSYTRWSFFLWRNGASHFKLFSNCFLLLFLTTSVSLRLNLVSIFLKLLVTTSSGITEWLLLRPKSGESGDSGEPVPEFCFKTPVLIYKCLPLTWFPLS